MPKEVTLDMLAESSKPVQKPIEEINNNNEVVDVTETVDSGERNAQEKPSVDVPKENTKGGPNIGPKMGTVGKTKMKPMDASQMAQQLIKDGVLEAKKDDTEEHPIVQNAFNSLSDTINERKKNIDNLLETMKNNAEEDKLNREFGIEDDDDDDEETTTNDKSSDDTSEDEDDLESELERQQNYSPEEPKKVEKREPEKLDFDDDDDEDDDDLEEDKPKKNDSRDSEDAELDDLINELDTDDDDNNSSDSDDDEDNPTGVGQDDVERYKKSFKSIKIIRNPIDLSKFSISDTPESNQFILKNITSSKNLRLADWALYHTKRSVTFKECSGPELEALRRVMENGNDITRIRSSLEFIYNHIQDANKPPFEAWTKLIRTEDVDSMYYGIYKASYSDANLIMRTCPSCNKSSLIEVPVEDMVVYGNPTDDHEKIKRRFKKIFNQDSTTKINPFKSELLQISDDYVVAYTPASLYSTFIMYSTLDAELTEKYAETLNIMSYIDRFFFIDRDNNELKPIKIKEYKDNLNKSVKAKLKIYQTILNTLNNDQYNVFMSTLNKFVSTPKINYITPKCVCPECGEEIPEAPVEGSMLNLLFTRAQLARIVSL